MNPTKTEEYEYEIHKTKDGWKKFPGFLVETVITEWSSLIKKNIPECLAVRYLMMNPTKTEDYEINNTNDDWKKCPGFFVGLLGGHHATSQNIIQQDKTCSRA